MTTRIFHFLSLLISCVTAQESSDPITTRDDPRVSSVAAPWLCLSLIWYRSEKGEYPLLDSMILHLTNYCILSPWKTNERMWNGLYSKVPMSLTDSQWHRSKPRSFPNPNPYISPKSLSVHHSLKKVVPLDPISMPTPWAVAGPSGQLASLL